MKFTIWGEIGATGEEGPVVLGGRLRLLLGGLLAHRNAEVSRADLIAIVWGEESEPANAEASLRQYVSRLRRALNEAEDGSGDLITTTPSGYRLDVDRAGVDADVLTDAVAGGRQPRDLDRLAVGEPYGTYSDEWWCFKETGRQRELASQARTQPIAGRSTPSGIVTFLMTDMENSTAQWDASQELMAEAVERHDAMVRAAFDRYGGYTFSTTGHGFAAAFERVGDAVESAVEVQRALQAEPWPEPIAVLVRMGLHTAEAQERDGDYFGPSVNRAARLMSCGAGGQILVSSTTAPLISEYELEPLGEHWLKDLRTPDRVSQVVADGLDRDFPPIRSLHVVPNNLPGVFERLVGRDYDAEQLAAVLAEHSLVTVVGMGGIGKTRLALDVATSEVPSFPDGAWWCELAPCSDAEAVLQTVARVVGARQRPGASLAQSVAEYCRHRQLLLVLDNCEHVLDTAASLAEVIADTGSSSSILATSREALGCPGEQTYPLSPLAVDGERPAATELFLRRASEIMPNREWPASDVAAIHRICRHLDGIPLAIELAASRVRSLSVTALEERLDRVFQVLRGGRRRIERHRTLQAAIDWSYHALEPTHALCFDRLAVFAGGWTLEAAEAIVADDEHIDELEVLDVLDDLIAKSLVTVDHSRLHQTRYRLLEPLRQFAEDQLANRGEVDQLRGVHSVYYTNWAEAWDERSWNDELAWRVDIETEQANLRAAVHWAVKVEDADHALRLVMALERAIAPFMFLEIGDWGALASSFPDAGNHPLGPVVAGSSVPSFFWRGDPETAVDLVERATAMPTYDPTAHHSSIARAMVEYHISRDREAAHAIVSRIAPRTPAEHLVRSWVRCGWFPDHTEAETDLETLRTIVEQTNSTVAKIHYDQAQTWVSLQRDNRVMAAEHARRAIHNAQRIGARFSLRRSVASLGLSAGTTGGLSRDELRLISQSLKEQRDAGQETDQWLVLISAAVVLWRHGRKILAARIYRAASASPWGGGYNMNHLARLHPGIDNYLDPAEPPVSLEELVDQVLAELPSVVEALSNPTGGLPT